MRGVFQPGHQLGLIELCGIVQARVVLIVELSALGKAPSRVHNRSYQGIHSIYIYIC